jgi:hypothetical protein
MRFDDKAEQSKDSDGSKGLEERRQADHRHEQQPPEAKAAVNPGEDCS